MWQKRRRREPQTGSISQWQFYSDRKVQLWWSCGAGCQSHKCVPSGFEQCVAMLSFVSHLSPPAAPCFTSEREKQTSSVVPVPGQRAHLSCPDTYIMRSTVDVHAATTGHLPQMRPLLNYLLQQPWEFCFLTHETEHFQNSRDIFHMSMRKQTPWTSVLANKGQTDFLLYVFLLVQRANTWQMSLKTLSFATASFCSKDCKLLLPESSGLKTIQSEDFQDIIERIHCGSESQCCFRVSYLSSLKNTRKQFFNEVIVL